MSDVIDRGSELEQTMREQAIARHQSRQRPRVSDGYCVDCGDAIPASRLQVNAYAARCIECQTAHEQNERLYRA